jgi:prophage regulatory protein
MFSPSPPAFYHAVFPRIPRRSACRASPVALLRTLSKPLIPLSELASRQPASRRLIAQIAQLTCVLSGFAQRELKMTHTILRLPDVKASTGLSRSTIYLRVSKGTFPRPVSLGGRAVGWVAEEIQSWLAERIAASRKAAA